MLMTRTNRHLNPWALLVPSTLVLLMVITAAALPVGEVKRLLFAVGLCTAIVLALATIFVGAARVDAAESKAVRSDALASLAVEEVTKLRTEMNALGDRVTRHVAFCPADGVPIDMDEVLLRLTQRPRSA